VKDPLIHALLFLVTSAVIVALGTCYSERSDERAKKLYPRRLLRFLIGCAIVAAILLVFERTLARV
jgi:H+/Cl- antiporter ClcA